MSKNFDEFKGADGLGHLLDEIPELSQLVSQAMHHDWSLDKFQNAIEDSDWWKNHSETARAVLIQRANDPASYKQSLNKVTSSLNSLAKQLGFSVDAAQLGRIATSALMSGNDGNQQWLTQQLGRRQDYSGVKSTAGLEGGMASTVSQLQELAGAYGFNWTPRQLANKAKQILVGNQTLDTYHEQLKTWASSAFPGLAKQIQSGATVKDLADPYVQSMSRLLEVDPGSLDVYTPAIRKALQGSRLADNKTGEPNPVPLWQFEQQVRSDPRWARTQNAKDTVSSVLVKLGQDFGFAT